MISLLGFESEIDEYYKASWGKYSFEVNLNPWIAHKSSLNLTAQ
jgi:hypothetical protein